MKNIAEPIMSVLLPSSSTLISSLSPLLLPVIDNSGKGIPESMPVLYRIYGRIIELQNDLCQQGPFEVILAKIFLKEGLPSKLD